jgi:hypothetical protein
MVAVYAYMRALWPVWIFTLLQALVGLALSATATLSSSPPAGSRDSEGWGSPLPDDVIWCDNSQWATDGDRPSMDVDREHLAKVRAPPWKRDQYLLLSLTRVEARSCTYTCRQESGGSCRTGALALCARLSIRVELSA